MCCEVSWAGEIHFAGLIFTQCSLVSATSLDGSTTTRQWQVCSFSFSLCLCLSVCLSVLLSRYLLLCPSNVLPAKSFISPRLKIIRWILIRFSISTFNHSPQSLLEAVNQCYFNLVTAIVVLHLTKSFDTYIWLEKLQYFWYRCKFPFHD